MYPGCQSGSCGTGPALRTWVGGSRPWPSPARRRWCAAGTPPWPRSPAGRRPPDAPGLQERRQETLQRLQVFIVIILWFSIIIYCLFFIPRTEKIVKYLRSPADIGAVREPSRRRNSLASSLYDVTTGWFSGIYQTVYWDNIVKIVSHSSKNPSIHPSSITVSSCAQGCRFITGSELKPLNVISSKFHIFKNLLSSNIPLT